MSFHTSAVCDGCERHLDADNEEIAPEDGWLILRYGADEEETSKDFCSHRCLTKWCLRGGSVDEASQEAALQKIDEIWRAAIETQRPGGEA